jgi:hypothetical protein
MFCFLLMPTLFILEKVVVDYFLETFVICLNLRLQKTENLETENIY